MSNTVLRQSPFVYTPLKMTVNEGNRSYTRIDENFKPYTVIDVLTKVYHRSFYDDLRAEICAVVKKIILSHRRMTRCFNGKRTVYPLVVQTNSLVDNVFVSSFEAVVLAAERFFDEFL